MDKYSIDFCVICYRKVLIVSLGRNDKISRLDRQKSIFEVFVLI